MVNRVILVGHCTRDTVAIATQGKAMARMRVATNAAWRDADGNRQEQAEFHSVVLFGRLAEIATQYCAKGRAVYLEGRLRTRDYVDGDGVRRFSTEVVAETVKLLGAGRRDESQPLGEEGDVAVPVEPVTTARGTRRKAA